MEFLTSEIAVPEIVVTTEIDPANETDTTRLTLLTSDDYTNKHSTSYLSFKHNDSSATEKYILKK